MLLNYEVVGGELVRKHTYKQWKAGTTVGVVGKLGYKTLSVKGKRYYSHRLIYLMVHGYLPDLVDHIDGNKTNNDPENLREFDKSGNALNITSPHKDNKSGYLGVTYRRDTGKFSARLCDKTLGSFRTPEEASDAYNKAKLGAT